MEQELEQLRQDYDRKLITRHKVRELLATYPHPPGSQSCPQTSGHDTHDTSHDTTHDTCHDTSHDTHDTCRDTGHDTHDTSHDTNHDTSHDTQEYHGNSIVNAA